MMVTTPATSPRRAGRTKMPNTAQRMRSQDDKHGLKDEKSDDKHGLQDEKPCRPASTSSDKATSQEHDPWTVCACSSNA